MGSSLRSVFLIAGLLVVGIAQAQPVPGQITRYDPGQQFVGVSVHHGDLVGQRGQWQLVYLRGIIRTADEGATTFPRVTLWINGQSVVVAPDKTWSSLVVVSTRKPDVVIRAEQEYSKVVGLVRSLLSRVLTCSPEAPVQ